MAILDDRFANIDAKLAKTLEQTRASTGHMGVRGDELAGAFGKIVLEHLVGCTNFYEKCEVTDTLGNRSQEVDLVFLNRFHPRFLLEDRPRAFFVEGIIAAAEVKTALNKDETINCLEKARMFKQLIAKVDGKDLQTHNIESEDWPRFLLRRPFFAFAYEDDRSLPTLQKNIEDWVNANQVAYEHQIDAFFVLNKGVIVNLGSGSGVLQKNDASGNPVRGFVRLETAAIFSELILWLSLCCPNFSSLHPILLRYKAFSPGGYVN